MSGYHPETDLPGGGGGRTEPPAGDEVPVAGVGPSAPEPQPRRPDPTEQLRFRDLCQVGFRSLLLQALWNPERMQGQGFAYSLRPIARRLFGRQGEAKWLARQMGYFNTNPPLVGCALGVVSRVEAEAMADEASEEPGLDHLKAALGATLAARGDPFFWSTLRPLAAMIGVLWMLEGSPYGPLIFLLLYNGFHLYARMRGVFQGARHGLGWLNVWVRSRLDRVRIIMQAIGVVASAVLINAVLDLGLADGGPTTGMWMGLGVALGMIWGERRRLSPVALGIGIFTVALAWATLDR
jgi:mannose/fructose/N-acetylgalactosamine-specific phosphotransferase system component IID